MGLEDDFIKVSVPYALVRRWADNGFEESRDRQEITWWAEAAIDKHNKQNVMMQSWLHRWTN